MTCTNERSPKDLSSIYSALVANRAEFFRLLESLEAQAGRELDSCTLQATIDSELAGCVSASEQEAIAAILSASRRRLTVVR